ncbi:anaphase-promoting complex subunit 11 [Nematocida homosporus]|uniref:anaphase-promoting complex subunit 11 n=1 Tax=Nematocida homosporus TaxID=1912981 RepID=UPI0022209BE1|nr:anaphase-promoting complex subunit 11 [Nematocida homosporus]KAI5186076.1 anaphase-promoting complex subunit 11 [Nematocida homosporus]
MYVRVNGLKVGYSWRWRVSEGICGICQQAFEQMCPECVHPLDCVPALGECKHYYHQHCIQKWQTSSSLCPICRAEWAEVSGL